MIKFNIEACMEAFEKYLAKAVTQARNELYNDVLQGLRTDEAKKELSKAEVKIIAGVITTAVIGGPWVAMDEWGTGSEMDLSNPALRAYIQGPYFNPVRRQTASLGFPKVGRPKGPYKDIFGRMKISRGNAGGINLEHLARTGKADKKYLPTPPSHAIRNAVHWMNNGRFKTIMQRAVNTFPWHEYLIVTNSKRG